MSACATKLVFIGSTQVRINEADYDLKKYSLTIAKPVEASKPILPKPKKVEPKEEDLNVSVD